MIFEEFKFFLRRETASKARKTKPLLKNMKRPSQTRSPCKSNTEWNLFQANLSKNETPFILVVKRRGFSFEGGAEEVEVSKFCDRFWSYFDSFHYWHWCWMGYGYEDTIADIFGRYARSFW